MGRDQDFGLSISLAPTQRQGGVTIYIICLSTGHIIRTPAPPVGIHTALGVDYFHADDFASSSLQGMNVLLKVSDFPTFLQFPLDAVVHRISSHEFVAGFEVLKSDLISRDVLAVHCYGKKTEKKPNSYSGRCNYRPTG